MLNEGSNSILSQGYCKDFEWTQVSTEHCNATQ